MSTKISLTALVLAVLATLGGAIVVGLSDTAPESYAEETPAKEEPSTEAVVAGEADPGKKTELPSADSVKKISKNGCLVDESAIADVQNARREIAAREQVIKKLELELQAKEKALKDELVRIEAVKDEIKQLNQTTISQNEEKIAKLVETFESMSPKSAAQVVSNIDENLAVESMKRLSSLKLGKILSALDPKKSGVLTERMAGVVRAPSRDTASTKAPVVLDDVAVATLSVKGGDNNGNRKQQSSSDTQRKEPEPALGK